MPDTQGVNHLGFAVRDLESTKRFFVECLGWQESGRDDSYPRTAVSDGVLRLTLWEVDHSLEVIPFNRRKTIGLHHLALTVPTEAALHRLAEKVTVWPDIKIEFQPELIGGGPRKHMIFCEPGGIRLEFIWSGTSNTE